MNFQIKVHLVDGTYELFRHFLAVPAAMDANGQDVGTEAMFLNILGGFRRRKIIPWSGKRDSEINQIYITNAGATACQGYLIKG